MMPKRKHPAKSPAKEPAHEPAHEAVPEAAQASETPAAPDAPAVVKVNFPVVGIGASAGGLAALEGFFDGMPAAGDPGMAFLVVQHLAPDHKSMLVELIARHTRMHVFEVEDGMQVRPNCVYVIPPKRDMAFLNGTLQLFDRIEARGIRLPIDFLFRSLAQDLDERAIGIVLSGTGSDGTLGARAIKGSGGLVMAQTPSSTEFAGMPQSLIDTGLVDYTLTPWEMPAQLIKYTESDMGRRPPVDGTAALASESALTKAFVLLRAHTGHDFSQYKPSTIQRRIDRRMVVHQIGRLDEYVRYLQQTPEEVQALFRDLLIGVTQFFRDRAVFQVLEKQVLPKLLANKPEGSTIRVWSAGCATGEEAYSLAILLQEQIEQLKKIYTVQVFATDIDQQAVATARLGVFPASISADVSPERLARYFKADPSGRYQIKKGIRDMLVFSEQDLIRDPPFLRLDFISCRNLMIYLGVELQRKLVPMLHYALNPGGTLLLGTSEGIGDFAGLFAVVDRQAKIYVRKEVVRPLPRANLDRAPLPAHPLEVKRPMSPLKPASPPMPLRQLMEQALLQQMEPCGVLVNAMGDVLYVHGRSGMFLEPSPGEPGVSNILKMARQGLRPALYTALQKTVATRAISSALNLRVKTNGHFTLVNVSAAPVNAAGERGQGPEDIYLVTLQAAPPLDASAQAAAIALASSDETAATSAQIVALTQELRANEAYLLSAQEALQISNEELTSTVEEMQSMNEELQSTNEELETSKEELQSVNEELATVNTELQTKVFDLSRVNNDMNNLLAGTGVASVFVDPELRILRFTPTAAELINLIPSDIGRPVGHIVSNLVGYTTLVADVQSVLDTLQFKEAELQSTEGGWYAMRILPYRTLDMHIEGVVLTFVDISVRKKAETKLQQQTIELGRLALVVRDARDAMIVQDLDGRTLAWNPGAVRTYGWTEQEALGMNVRDRIPEQLRAQALDTLTQLVDAKILAPFLTQRISKQGNIIDVSIITTALHNEVGKLYAIATTERAIPNEAP
jgi:two-component system CheB/CheR fusion protein